MGQNGNKLFFDRFLGGSSPKEPTFTQQGTIAIG